MSSAPYPQPVAWPYLQYALLAAATAAPLAAAQIGIAELAGITTLGAEFAAGNERVQGVHVTLVTWYCALAVPLAVTIPRAGRVLGSGIRLAAVPAAALSVLAALPRVPNRSSDIVRPDMVSGVVAGTLLGVLGGLCVAAAPAIGRGLASYVALLWIAALTFTATVVLAVALLCLLTAALTAAAAGKRRQRAS